MSSDWPVCPVSETAAPHRLGAALTYARRYALFTLVGIAGEDDLDAPDLPTADGPSASQNGPQGCDQHHGVMPNPSPSQAAGWPLQAAERRPRSKRPAPQMLSGDASDDLRRRLTSELEQLENSAALASWAQRALPLKNQLSMADAQALEDAFTAKLSQFGEAQLSRAETPGRERPWQPVVTGRSANRRSLSFRKPVRERDREHLKFVASQPCVICGRAPSDAHHIKFAEQRAMGRKVSDRFTVPICRLHHRELHRRGNERVWWESQGIEPLVIAATLWDKTHAVMPAANVAGDQPTTINGKLNGLHFGNGPGGARRSQNDETKPILRAEAE